jgi:hypothetical protein
MARGAYRQERRNFEKTPAQVLSHPLRVRILEIVNQRDISPARFVREQLAGDRLDHLGERAAVSHIAYHFRQLEEFGCVEVVEQNPRRGSIENVYRGVARAYFGDDEWRSLPAERRKDITAVVLQGLMARAEGAILEETFDARDDRWLFWVDMDLDERGWDELSELCNTMMSDVEEVHDSAERRLADSTDGDGAGDPAARAPTTFAVLAFESPE